MYFPAYPENSLEYGDKNSKVQLFQSAINVLIKKYPICGNLIEDGIFGKNTENAAKRLQQHVGLKETGKVDGYTWIAAFSLSNIISGA